MLIAAAGNTEAAAYFVLEGKGFQVQRLVLDGAETWIATRDDQSFRGDGPLQLLGLVALHEIRGDQWQAGDKEIDRFLSTFNLDS